MATWYRMVEQAQSLRVAPWLVACASVLILGSAHLLEAFGMRPCDLCLRQREAYWIALGLAAAAGLVGFAKPKWMLSSAYILMSASALALLYGAARAVQHIGAVEHISFITHLWPTTCSGGGNLTVEEALKGGGAPLIACDSAPRFLKISLPAYNLAVALALAAFTASVPLRQLFSRRQA
jgi:disulfide bond formation protein DsbB